MDQVILFSCDLIKWNSDKMRIGISFNLYFKKEIFSHLVDIQIRDNTEAVQTSVEEIEKITKEKFSLVSKDKVELKNADIIQTSLKQYYGRLQRELSSNRNGKSKHKPSITRYNLFYLKDPEINLLDDEERYLAYVDIIERKARKEQYTQIGNYLVDALLIKPRDKKLIKYQARYYMDTNQPKEAVAALNRCYAHNPNDKEIVTQLIRLYDETGDYKNAEEWCEKVLGEDPENLDALVRKAQYKYFRKQAYFKELDHIQKVNSEWLKEYLRKTWNYRIPKTKMDLSPIKTARYLGYEKALDIVSFAFKNVIPCDANTREARVMFSKEEIDAWHNLIARYDVNDYAFSLFPESIRV